MDNFKDYLSSVGGAMAISALMLFSFEGMVNTVYLDSGKKITACLGDTEDLERYHVGMTLTDAECIRRFKIKHPKVHSIVRKNVHVPMTQYQEASYASFAYNVGDTAFINSTLLKKTNAGDRLGGCNEMLRWTYTPAVKGSIEDLRDGKRNGKKDCAIKENKCSGLLIRRTLEREACLK